jgi:hypothetical protein
MKKLHAPTGTARQKSVFRVRVLLSTLNQKKVKNAKKT